MRIILIRNIDVLKVNPISTRRLERIVNVMKGRLNVMHMSAPPAQKIFAGIATIMICSMALTAKAQTQKEMWDVIQKQQRQIEALTKKQSQTDKSVEATAAAVQDGASSGGWWNKTSIGGYGEVHYNGGDTDRVDIHRYVLNVNHQFSDKVRLYTELEVEHGLAGDGDDKPGEVEVEQAWVEFDLDEATKAKAGVFIIPVGILNETHEPPTFYGVERNNVEKNIIPATWWEAGAGLTFASESGLQTDIAFHSGLDVPNTGSSAFKIRKGRQKVAEATAREPAVTGRLKYTGMPGVELATTLQYQNDITQGDVSDVKSSAFLISAHGIVTRQLADNASFTLKALYAAWNIDGTAAEALGRDKQSGYYIEPSVKFDMGEIGDLGFYLRYSADDNTEGDETDSEIKETVVGLNYWPHEDVVLKMDYSVPDPPAGSARNEMVRAGIGFQF
jgi:hypothetical protein